MKIWFGALAGVMMVGLSACPNVTVSQIVSLPKASPEAVSEPTADPAQAAVFQAVHDNANALNAQNVTDYTRSLALGSEILQGMPEIFVELVRVHTQYSILETKVLSLSAETASVAVRRRTSNANGTIEQQMLYTLRRDSGAWKVLTMMDQSETK